jgi:coenzyme F420 hydrogenase subunit beta
MIKDIVNKGFCLGCGLCSSVLGEDKCEMKLFENGFYYPVLKSTKVDDHKIKYLCPGIRVQDDRKHDIWGHVVNVAEAWANDKDLRFKAASGGVSSAIALYMLEKGIVDGILQVGQQDGSPIYNELKITTTRDGILKNAQSRYAPALTLHHIKQILDKDNKVYAFIGKPCDIAGIKNLQKQYPVYKDRIKYTISIFCAGMPTYNATKKTYSQSGRTDLPESLKYRGEGWPGSFRAIWSDGQKYEISYNDSWGKILGHNLGFRCKICPDGIGLLADISVGDSWNTKDGYPDFTETDGRNFCFIRTEAGNDLFHMSVNAGYITSRNLNIDDVKNMQAYQYDRRHLVGWRILGPKMMNLGLLQFKGLGLINQAIQYNLIKGVKITIGTLKRYIKNKKAMTNIYNPAGGAGNP